MARRFNAAIICTIPSVDQIGHSGAHRSPQESGHSPIISTNPSSRTLPDRSSSHQHQQTLALDFAPLLS